MNERIQKFLARKGYGSRREIERWIIEGKIRSPLGISKLGDRVSLGDTLILKNKVIEVDESKSATRVLVYHKQSGEICTHNDPQDRPTVIQSLPKIQNGRWLSVGRLDINTTGLLLFSNDGELVHKLMHPASGLERVYLCRVWGKVDERILEQLHKGVSSKNEILKFDDIERLHKKGANSWFRIVLSRGKNREIHRAWKSVGYRVSRLKRVQYGMITLPKDLKPGSCFELKPDAIKELQRIVNRRA